MLRSRSGLASHLVVGALAFLAGVSVPLVAWRSHTARAPHATTHGEWVWIHRGADSVHAYVGYPERQDKAPAVVVIHEIFGLTDWEPRVVDDLAAHGYVAIVPDLLSSRYGATPADPDSGVKLVSGLDPNAVTADLDAAYAYVNGLPAVRTGDVGVIGFCWGGGQSFRYATNNPKLKAAVICYGPPPDSAALARIQAPLLGVYGESDARIDATIPATDSLLRKLGKSYRYTIYPGTGHGFLKPGRHGYDTPSRPQAWNDVLDFFRERLKP
ncbi:MAG TPA: dienelactone hydrolase family protein [Gemmatimonadales bacterium]|nr:dienelactone hydrolase family protein [Gemmatimonadales bacterium]